MTKKTILSVATALTILTASCGGNKENKETADNQQKETVANVDVRGQWYLDSIVFSDSEYVRVRPDERLSSIHQYIVFEDSTYFIRTNCNSISGTYAVKVDSIILGDGAMTEMACDDMAVEGRLQSTMLPASLHAVSPHMKINPVCKAAVIIVSYTGKAERYSM